MTATDYPTTDIAGRIQASGGYASQKGPTKELAAKLIFDGRELDLDASSEATGMEADRLLTIFRSCKVIEDDSHYLAEGVETPATVRVKASSLAPAEAIAVDSAPVPAPSKAPGGKAPRVPYPKVPTRKPDNQNQYALAVWNSRNLTTTQKTILMGLALEFGMDRGTSKRPYGECSTEASKDYIQGHAKIGANTADTQMRTLVELGWLRRLDNGVGGRGGKNTATYAPLVPVRE